MFVAVPYRDFHINHFVGILYHEVIDLIILIFSLVFLAALFLKIFLAYECDAPKTDIIIYAPSTPEDCERRLRQAVLKALRSFGGAEIFIKTEDSAPEILRIVNLLAKDYGFIKYVK